MASLPKDNHLMDRPYSGRAVLYDLLRQAKGATVSMKQFEKACKAQGRKITAFPRVLYWVGKAVEEYGYDLETDNNSDGDVTGIRLIKGSGESKPKKKSKPSKKEKPASKKKSKTSSKKEKPTSKKKAKPSSKKRSSKKDSESESESSESESKSESENESDEA